LNSNQLCKILSEVCPALHSSGKLWIAYPKATSKITSDLNRDCSWSSLTGQDFEALEVVELDYVWSAQLFTRVQVSVCLESSSGTQKFKSSARRKVAEIESY
jgi:hypothetical protein